jgi:hypothetical protein
MFERFSRSWALVKASADVLRQDKELLVFPLVSTIATVIVGASFILPAIGMGLFEQAASARDSGTPPIGLMVWSFLLYLAQYFVIFFFNSALVGAAMIRLEGGDPTVGDGLRIASSKIVPILGYAAIAATVGMILRAIQERAGFVGRWIVGLLGVAWTIATFLVVPILVTRNVGPVDALKESATLLRKTWGESLIGNGGIGLAFGLVYFLLIFLAAGLVFAAAATQSVPLIVTVVLAFVAVFVLLALVHAALSGIYSAALYRYAAEGQGSGQFSAGVLADAFRHKG